MDRERRIVVVVEPQLRCERVGLEGETPLILVFENGSYGVTTRIAPCIYLRLVKAIVGIRIPPHGAVVEIPYQTVAWAYVLCTEGDGIPFTVSDRPLGCLCCKITFPPDSQ